MSECRWFRDDDGAYATDCGQCFVPIEGTTCEWARYCCWCGLPIKFETKEAEEAE